MTKVINLLARVFSCETKFNISGLLSDTDIGGGGLLGSTLFSMVLTRLFILDCVERIGVSEDRTMFW